MISRSLLLAGLLAVFLLFGCTGPQAGTPASTPQPLPRPPSQPGFNLGDADLEVSGPVNDTVALTDADAVEPDDSTGGGTSTIDSGLGFLENETDVLEVDDTLSLLDVDGIEGG